MLPFRKVMVETLLMPKPFIFSVMVAMWLPRLSAPLGAAAQCASPPESEVSTFPVAAPVTIWKPSTVTVPPVSW